MIDKYLKVTANFNNTLHPHMSVDMMTPREAARCNGEIRKWWISYREEVIKNCYKRDNIN